MATQKIMTVTLEFEMGDRVIRGQRITAAYEAAVSAAVEAAKAELSKGSVSTVRSRMTWDYRWAELSAQYSDVEDAGEEPVQ
ncbi:hypothetical protein RM550_34870 [Streptomyces sp. DSM 41527]|uniref:Uncharacterized protein n=1 Tax=Streptomyces mooreae TaxID=3075523 RepID=A0ABU2TIW3_9ACTN|nr:hypothetical protein [Streptomyces sp. DSM 41527]MDT0460845.1 hypothetical protein [Streptomyces sp. DSM 41527]